MKKRMLITTIVMVLVVAIALTTSSLAWFTMSATVEISEVSFGAAAYTGAQMSVSELDRLQWGSSADIGTFSTPFDPTQGEPISGYIWGDVGEGGMGPVESGTNNLTIGTSADWSAFAVSNFYKAETVETTAAGNETADQKVELEASTSAVFIGGFNVRNDGVGSTTAKINAALKVGTAVLINPDNSTSANGDEYYAYGVLGSALAGLVVTDNASSYGAYKYDGAGPAGADANAKKATVLAAFQATDADEALAGGLRVAVFTRTWEETAGTYVNAPLARRGIYNFTQYKVTWSNGWSVAAGTEATPINSSESNWKNNLYVTTPAAGVYSMNENLAIGTGSVPDPAFHVDSGNGAITQYTTTDVGLGNALPQISQLLAGKTATTYGMELVVIVWMDGWDSESVPAAGGGRVSLAYTISDVVA